jgi:hypothetical protein
VSLRDNVAPPAAGFCETAINPTPKLNEAFRSLKYKLTSHSEVLTRRSSMATLDRNQS